MILTTCTCRSMQGGQLAGGNRSQPSESSGEDSEGGGGCAVKAAKPLRASKKATDAAGELAHMAINCSGVGSGASSETETADAGSGAEGAAAMVGAMRCVSCLQS